MKDDKLKNTLTPLELNSLDRMKRRHARMLTWRDMWYAMKVAEIRDECLAALTTAPEGEEDEIDVQIREDLTVCESFLELVSRAYDGGTDPNHPEYEEADLVSKNFLEIGISAVMERFGHIIGPEGGFNPPQIS